MKILKEKVITGWKRKTYCNAKEERYTDSPIIIRQNIGGILDHIFLSEQEAVQLHDWLTKILE